MRRLENEKSSDDTLTTLYLLPKARDRIAQLFSAPPQDRKRKPPPMAIARAKRQISSVRLPSPPRPKAISEPVIGFIDAIRGSKISGWARRGSSPVTICIRENDQVISRGEAVEWREDLKASLGFSIDLGIRDLGRKLLDGTVKITAGEGEGSIQLPLIDGLRGPLLLQRFVADIPEMGPKLLSEGLKYVQGYILGANRDYAIWQTLEGTQRDEMTTVTMPVGLLSLDHNVTVGRNGHLFLVGGTNSLLAQYSRDPGYAATAAKVADQWLETFKTRKKRLEGSGIRFIQNIIPEKISLLNDMFPRTIENKTVITRYLTEALKAEKSLAANYVDGLACLSNPVIREEAFQKLDTHLAPIGARAIADAIGKKLKAKLLPPDEFEKILLLGGDLGRRIASPRARAELPIPSGEAMARLGKDVKRIDYYEQPNGFVGTRAVYTNEAAPNSEKVVVFGNSFFQTGDNSTHISWWMLRMFKEYHFVWSPELDYSYVEKVKPDIVVCQTIERFLVRNVSN